MESIQEVLPMVNDFIAVTGFILFLLQKLIETAPPRLLEVC